MEKGYMVTLYGYLTSKGTKFFKEKPSKETIEELMKSQPGIIRAFVTECEYIENHI